MATYDYNKPIAVTTVNTEDYPHPTLKDGRWVVSASAVKLQPNKVVLYTPTSRLYTPVTPWTVSVDYYNQVKHYENNLSASTVDTTGWSNGEDPHQINSFADVLVAGNESAHPIKGTFKAIGQLFTGHPVEAAKTWWDNSAYKTLTTKLNAGTHLITDTLLLPLVGTDDTETKAAKLFNNAMINLSETMDMFTLANSVKGFMQGDTDAVNKGFGDPYGSGRYQYNWNIHAGGGWKDTLANIVAETLTDPTTWLSLGSSAVFKQTGKAVFGDVFKQSADEVGIALTKEQADVLAKGAISSVLHNGTPVTDALAHVNIDRVFKDASEKQVVDFFNAIKKNAHLVSENKTLKFVGSVYNTSEGVQKAALKTVAYTTAMGYSVQALKGIFKPVMSQSMPYLLSKLKLAVGKTDPSTVPLKNLPEHLKTVEADLKDLKDVVGLKEDFPQEMIASVTHNIQELKYNKLYDIMHTDKPAAVLIADLNKWAIGERFENILDLSKNLLNVKSIIPNDLRRIVSEVNNRLSQLYADAANDVMQPLITDLKNITKLKPSEYVGVINNLKLTRELGITYADIDPKLFDNAIAVLNSRVRYEGTMAALDIPFDEFPHMLINKFDETTKTYRHVAILDLDTKVVQRLRYNLLTIIKQPDLNELFGTEARTILRMFKTWESGTIPTGMLRQSNSALTKLKTKMADVTTNLSLDSMVANTLDHTLDALTDKLENFANSFVKQVQSTDAVVYTDNIIGKAAKHMVDTQDVLIKAADMHNLTEAQAKELYVPLVNSSDNLKFAVDPEAISSSYETLRMVNDLLDNVNTGSYYIREGGLQDIIDEWATDGFSVGLGNTLIDALDKATINMPKSDAITTTLQMFREDIQDLVNTLSTTDADRVKVTQKLLSSGLYSVKLSHAQALSMLLNTEYVRPVLDNVRTGLGVGQLFQALSDATRSTPAAYAVDTVQSLAKSVYVADRIINLIDSNKTLPDVWKDGLYDTLAGEMRKGTDTIDNVEATTARFLATAKEFIDNSHNAHLPRLHELDHIGHPYGAADSAIYLYKAIFAPETIDQSGTIAKYWKPVQDALAKDENAFNIVYIAGQTGYQSGTIYEFSFVLPDGTFGKYVDKSMRDTVLQTIDNKTARRLYGKSKAEVKQMIKDSMKYDIDANVRIFDTTEDFATAMYGLFKEVKSSARAHNLNPRLIGFNSDMSSAGTDAALARFMNINRTNTRIAYNDVEYKSIMTIKTFDAAAMLRINYENAAVITDDMRTEVTNIVRTAKEYMEQANSRTDYGTAHLMPDFNRNVTGSLREILNTVDNAIELMHGKGGFINITKDQFDIIQHTFSVDELLAYRTTISNMLQNIGATLLTIKNTNNALGQYVLVQDAISKLLHEPNVMQVLYKYFTEPGGTPIFSYKKLYDPDTLNEWFDLPSTGVEDLLTVTKMNSIAARLQRGKSKIYHPLLLMGVPNKDMQNLVDFLKAKFIEVPNYKYSEWAKEVMMLKPANNQINNYLIAKTLWDSITKVSDIDTIGVLTEELYELDNPATLYIRFPEGTVEFSDSIYVPGIDVLHSELIKASNYIMQTTKEINAITSDTHMAETLNDALFLDQRLRDKYGYNLPNQRMKEEMVTLYGNFVNHIKDDLNNALINAQQEYDAYLESTGKEEAALFIRRIYTENVEKVMAQLDALTSKLADRRTNYIMTLTPDNYAKFLYKYSQGVQILDMNAEVFKHKPGLINTFMHTLKDAEQYGIKPYEDNINDKIIIYLDKNYKDLASFDEWTKDFKFEPKSIEITADTSAIEKQFIQFSNKMDELFDGTYSISMQRTMNDDRYKELLGYLPEAIRNNIPVDLYNAKELVDGAFNQTILGDYASGVGDIFTVYSGNIVTNVAAGFNTAFNRLRGKDMYASLLFNSHNQLKTWVESIERFGKVTHSDVVDAVDKNDYVVCNIVDNRVVTVDISTIASYQEAMKSGAVLLDYYSYNRAVEIINNNYIKFKPYRVINKYLGALKIAMILSTGWLVRNIFDSEVKGWVQAGLDPMYMISQFTQTKRIMAEYDRTYADIFTTTGGNLSPAAVKKFFTEHGTEVPLDETTFRKMLTFYTSTSAQPTLIQLNLNKDFAYKMFQRLKGNPDIELKDVKYAVKVFQDTAAEEHPYLAALGKLKERYSDPIANDLVLLRKYMPKSIMKQSRLSKIAESVVSSNTIMRGNMSVETFVRTHTFLYHTIYNDSSVSQALKKVDISQFNRHRDTKAMHLLETLLPFSSFQIDNFLFWSDIAKQGRGNVLALTEDVLNGMYDDEQLDTEELARNMSLQYLYLSGNLILDDSTGETFKLNNSLNNTLQLLNDPVGTFANMVNVPMDTVHTLINAINADEAAYDKDNYNNTKPISRWSKEDWKDEMLQLIPLVGVIRMRWESAFNKYPYADPEDSFTQKLEKTACNYQISDAILPLVMPSLFGISKLDSARPIGFDWYNQTEEYKRTHRFVFGVSYVPSWMDKDPSTYANTYQRLINMGYPKEVALEMLQNGWYMKAPMYKLRHYVPYTSRLYIPYTHRVYARKAYPTFAKRIYPKRTKRMKSFKLRLNRPEMFYADRVYTEYPVRKVYRPKLYSDRYTRTGVDRETLIKWRGANRSSRQLLRDRSAASRRRTQRIIRQVRPL